MDIDEFLICYDFIGVFVNSGGLRCRGLKLRVISVVVFGGSGAVFVSVIVVADVF